MRTLLAVLLAAINLAAAEIVAHRGASYDAPENTVAAFKLAFEQGADGAELDCYLSKDGQIWCLHDDTLKRTAGIDRKIAEMTGKELAEADAGVWKGTKYKGEKLPRLSEMLAVIPAGKKVFIEVKCGPEIVPQLVKDMQASGLKPEQLVVIAFNDKVIDAIKKARHDLQAYWLVSLAAKKDKPSPKVEDLIRTAKRIGADGLNVSATPEVLTPEFAAAVKSAGLKLLVWTVDDTDLARKMIALGAIGVTTNRPAFLRERLKEDAASLHLMSFNIRFANNSDGDNAWAKRKELLFETVKTFDPDILGTQETLLIQKDDLAKKFANYAVFAAGRDDGKEAGEMMAVYYRKSRFEKLDGGHFWLSEKPSEPGSKSWDSSLPRMATWLKLKDRNAPDAKPILYLNTHFDHRGPASRLEAAKLLRGKLKELGEGCRVVFSGDFNCGEGSAPYKTVFDDKAEWKLCDTFRCCHLEKGKNEGTANGFRADAVSGARIDWIGCTAEWKVISAAIDRTVRDGRTPSDHFAVTAVLGIAK